VTRAPIARGDEAALDLVTSRSIVPPRIPHRFRIATALIVAGLPCTDAVAQSRPTLSGTWSASAMIVQYNIGDWGEKCGPRPSGGGPGGGTVTIVQSGNELTINGAGGSYSTTNCFEQMPGLKRSSHSAAPRGWSNRCTTAANDPRQAVIITSISATDDTISFSETGTYQFVLEGQNCTASVRRTRSFRLLQREGEPPPSQTATPSATLAAPPPVASTAAPTQTAPPPPPPAACASIGEPARIEVRPARKLMRPGEEFSFSARVVDAKGCRVDVRPTWSVPSNALTVDSAGKVRVPADAPEGSTDLDVAFGGQHVRVVVEVASNERYDALLSARGLNARGEAEEAAMVTIASGSLGGGAAVGEDAARRRKLTFVGIVGGMALVLAVAGLLLLRRGSRKKAVEVEEEVVVERPRPARAAPAPAPVAAPVDPRPRLSCPVCRKHFPPDGIFCPDDGTRLVPVTEQARPAPAGGVCPVCKRGFDASTRVCPEHGEALVPAPVFKATAQKPAAVEPKGKICPTCGARYGGEAIFCGKDGTTLVLVN